VFCGCELSGVAHGAIRSVFSVAARTGGSEKFHGAVIEHQAATIHGLSEVTEVRNCDNSVTRLLRTNAGAGLLSCRLGELARTRQRYRPGGRTSAIPIPFASTIWPLREEVAADIVFRFGLQQLRRRGRADAIYAQGCFAERSRRLSAVAEFCHDLIQRHCR